MKAFPILLLSIFVLSSCGMSKDDKDTLEANILIHNTKASYQFISARNDEELRLNMKYFGKKEKQTMINLDLAAWESEWFRFYDIKKDTALTMEKYLEYCKANGFDPKTKIKFLD